jgi:hypothetical protein
MKKIINYIKIPIGIILIIVVGGCKKLTQVPEPVNTVTTSEAFSSDASATSVIAGIYSNLLGTGSVANPVFGNGLTTIDAGLSADELQPFRNSGLLYSRNALNSSDGDLLNNFWSKPYFDIYVANSAIETLPNSTAVSGPVKKQLLGEAEFFRAFSNFYLINLFGDVPLATTTAYNITDTLHRSPSLKIYQQIIADLTDAQSKLAEDYSFSGGERVRVNKYGATALLARTYLYLGNLTNNKTYYVQAAAQADSVINNTGLYSLVSDLNEVFLANSNEAILQLKITYPPFATAEGTTFNTINSTAEPAYYLTNQLLASFESNDQRLKSWVNMTHYAGSDYYYPYKYKVKVATDNATEYYMVLRLAEQYLIRAEARAQQNELTGPNGAIADLNAIRDRAGLPNLPQTLDQSDILAAVAQERKIELFAEWGHRWFDLKRTGQAQTVLSGDKGFAVPANQLLYPIPASELINDANLVQNPGY